MCCMAMTAECMACSAGVSVKNFCKKFETRKIARLPKKTNETSYVLQSHDCMPWRARLVYRWKNFAKVRNTEDCSVAQKTNETSYVLQEP